MLLSTIIENRKPHRPLVVVQSQTAQTALPILRTLIRSESRNTLLFCLLYAPDSLITPGSGRDDLSVHDFTSRIPGFTEDEQDVSQSILSVAKDGACQFLEFLLISETHAERKRSTCWSPECDHRLGRYACIRSRIHCRRFELDSQHPRPCARAACAVSSSPACRWHTGTLARSAARRDALGPSARACHRTSLRVGVARRTHVPYPAATAHPTRAFLARLCAYRRAARGGGAARVRRRRNRCAGDRRAGRRSAGAWGKRRKRCWEPNEGRGEGSGGLAQA
jgi:hypothetical protein